MVNEPNFMQRIQQRVEALHAMRKAKPKMFQPWFVRDCAEIKTFSPYSKKIFEHSWSYQRQLEKHGFVRLGSGSHSTVYAKPTSDRVLKVNFSNDNWPDYIAWAKEKGYVGNFAPKIYSLKQHKGFYVCSMERLETTVADTDHKHPLAFAHGIFEYACNHQNDNAKIIADLIIPGLSKFGDDLHAEFKSGLDIHGGNFMLRKDGSLVAVDPVYGKPSGKSYRIKNAA